MTTEHLQQTVFEVLTRFAGDGHDSANLSSVEARKFIAEEVAKAIRKEQFESVANKEG